MMEPADFDADWEMFHPKTKVTYIPFNNDTDTLDDAKKVCGIDALILPQKKAEQLVAGTEVFTNSRVWALRRFQMKGINVTRRGVIVDCDGVRWMVNTAQSMTFNTRWHCETVWLP